MHGKTSVRVEGKTSIRVEKNLSQVELKFACCCLEELEEG
jgi:hypothetical protein